MKNPSMQGNEPGPADQKEVFTQEQIDMSRFEVNLKNGILKFRRGVSHHMKNKKAKFLILEMRKILISRSMWTFAYF